MTDPGTPAPAHADKWMVPCTHWMDPDGYCGATPTRDYMPGRRCADHTPARLNDHPEVRPDPSTTLDGLRAKAKLVSTPPPASATSKIEDRHVASGKRRSKPAAYKEARARLDAGR